MTKIPKFIVDALQKGYTVRYNLGGEVTAHVPGRTFKFLKDGNVLEKKNRQWLKTHNSATFELPHGRRTV